MQTELQRLIKKYDLEQLVELKTLLDEEVINRVQKMNKILGLNNPVETFVKVSQNTNESTEPIKETKEAVEETKVENNNDTAKNDKTNTNNKQNNKPWDTKDMPKTGKYNKETKEYEYFETDKEGLLTSVTCNINNTTLGGQVAHDGRIYNYIFSNKYELPVVYGPVSKEFLTELKESILNNLPENFVMAEPLDSEFKSHYGYEGRFYYDKLEEGKFIYKTKDGYKGFTDGMSFRVLSHEDIKTHEEVIDTMNVLSVNYFFSQNYENAFSDRQKKLHPTLIDNIKELITKVNNRFDGLDEEETTVVNNGGLLDGLMDTVEETKEETKVKDTFIYKGQEVDYELAAKRARRPIWN